MNRSECGTRRKREGKKWRGYFKVVTEMKAEPLGPRRTAIHFLRVEAGSLIEWKMRKFTKCIELKTILAGQLWSIRMHVRVIED